MKILKIIITTFIIAFATSALFELKFIDTNLVRYILVILLILIELAIGFFYVKSEVKSKIINQQSEI
jgi:uncharacterized membrane protein